MLSALKGSAHVVMSGQPRNKDRYRKHECENTLCVEYKCSLCNKKEYFKKKKGEILHKKTCYGLNIFFYQR